MEEAKVFGKYRGCDIVEVSFIISDWVNEGDVEGVLDCGFCEAVDYVLVDNERV